MTDLLILFILQKNKSSIYGIKKEIDSKFCNYFSVSLGAIHPGLKRLEDKQLITLSKQISSGGQRKSTYSITEKGTNHFKDLIQAELPNHPSNAEQLINLKLLALDMLDEKSKKIILTDIARHYEKLKIMATAVLNKIEISQHHSSILRQEIKTLEFKIERIALLAKDVKTN